MLNCSFSLSSEQHGCSCSAAGWEDPELRLVLLLMTSHSCWTNVIVFHQFIQCLLLFLLTTKGSCSSFWSRCFQLWVCSHWLLSLVISWYPKKPPFGCEMPWCFTKSLTIIENHIPKTKWSWFSFFSSFRYVWLENTHSADCYFPEKMNHFQWVTHGKKVTSHKLVETSLLCNSFSFITTHSCLFSFNIVSIALPWIKLQISVNTS